jgi:hypothetical protein
LIVAVLVFGGAAATASAAQSSLPLDALYPLKTLSESVELGLTVSPTEKVEKALEHAERRVDEMKALGQTGTDVPEHLAEGYTEQVEYTLRLAAKMSDPEMTQALEKIQTSLQQQQGAVAGLLATRPGDVQLAVLAKQLGQYVELAGLGQSQPGMFREQMAALLQGFEEPSSTQDPNATETPEPGDDNSNDANANDSNTNGDDANGNASNSNDDSANSNGSDDSNANGDQGNSNGSDDGNANDDQGNSNGSDDGNANDDQGNSNGSDDGNANDDQGNSNGSDDGNANDDSGNSNDNDSNANNNDDGNGNDDNGNGSDDSPNSGAFLNSFVVFVNWIKGAVFA